MRDTSGTKSVSYRLSIAYRLAAIGQDGPSFPSFIHAAYFWDLTFQAA